MYTLTLYKNLDENQPQVFEADACEKVVADLRDWLNANNGEDDKPCQIDGLTLDAIDYEASYNITLIWDECYEDWQITWGNDSPCAFSNWKRARDAFADACSYEIEREAD